MTDRRPYDPDPRRNSAPGRPDPNAYRRRRDDAPSGREPSAGLPRDRYEPETGSWNREENTQMIGKLGFVPPEAKHDRISDDFDPDRISSDDKAKYRTRKRARKASPWKILGIAVLAVALVAGAVVGAMALWGGGDDSDSDSDLKYEASDSSCDLLDVSALDDVTGGSEPEVLTDETEREANKSKQTCEVTDPEAGVNVQIVAETFQLEARAARSYERHFDNVDPDGADDVADVDGIGSAAYSLTRIDDGSARYELRLHDGNAYVLTTVSLYGDNAADADVEELAQEVAGAYLDNWSS